MSIDPNRPIPLYFQLKTLLLEEILRGGFAPAARLPTEHELCHLYGISRTPVKRALSELAEEGVVLRTRRRGTFVNPHWIARDGNRPELRIVVPEGHWEAMVRAATPEDMAVSFVTVPRTDLHTFLAHAVAEGQAPDLAVLDSVWVSEFATAGFLHALDDLDEGWLRGEYEVDFLEPLVSANRHRGRTFVVSADAAVAGLWYRRRELELRGLEPPVTWADLRAVARALARDGMPHPVVMPAGSRGGETTTYCLIALLASNAASVLGPSGVTLDSAATTQTLRFLRRLVDEDLMSRDVVGFEWTRSMRILAEGHAALSFGGSYEGHHLAEALKVSLDDLREHVGFIPVPAGPRGAPASCTGSMVFGIFRQAAHPILAVRLLERIVAPDALARVSVATGRIPPRRSAIELAGPHSPFVSLAAEILEGAVARPATPAYPRVSAQLQAMLEAVLTGRLSPSAAARRSAETIAAITGLPVVQERPPAAVGAAI
jgi:multiple sugar transport system substrate-binding protein